MPKLYEVFITQLGLSYYTLPYSAYDIKAIIIGGGGGSSTSGNAEDGDKTILRWFGNVHLVEGGKGGYISTEYCSNIKEESHLVIPVGGEGGSPLGTKGQTLTRDIVFLNSPIIATGGRGYDIGDINEYGNGADATYPKPVNRGIYKLAAGGSGGYKEVKVEFSGINKTLSCYIGKGGKGSGRYGKEGKQGVIKLEYYR